MTRDDIYDHLAQVYIGKRKQQSEEKKSKQFNVWLFINIIITAIIFTSAFYGLSAFLAHQRPALKQSVIYSLHNGPVQIEYDFRDPSLPSKVLSLSMDEVDAAKYGKLDFSLRAKEEGSPGIVKVEFTNARNEKAFYYIQGVNQSWQKFSIPFENFSGITDWSSVHDISFILESWNVDSKKGVILIDDLRFSNM